MSAHNFWHADLQDKLGRVALYVLSVARDRLLHMHYTNIHRMQKGRRSSAVQACHQQCTSRESCLSIFVSVPVRHLLLQHAVKGGFTCGQNFAPAGLHPCY